LELKAKLNCLGSDLAIEMWRTCVLDKGDSMGVGYIGFEVVGVCNWLMCKGGAGWSQKWLIIIQSMVVSSENDENLVC
jgi:hypothetical protein